MRTGLLFRDEHWVNDLAVARVAGSAFVATASADRAVRFIELETGGFLRAPIRTPEIATGVAIAPDSGIAVVASGAVYGKGSLNAWHILSGERIWTLPGILAQYAVELTDVPALEPFVVVAVPPEDKT